MDGFEKAVTIIAVSVCLLLGSSCLYSIFVEADVAKEAIKAGLVQKIEQNERIWARP